MEKNSFKVSAELLQKNAVKASIRDLNAEFQMKGGRVTPSKNGDTYQLFHPEEAYLEEFRVRLFRELGLIEEKDVPKELQKPQGPTPRYGDTHKLRPGWNVRSDREKNMGIRDDRPPGHPGRDHRDHHRRDDRDGQRFFRDDRSKGPPRDDYRGNDRRPEPSGDESDEGVRSFEERWGNIDDHMQVIKKALEDGAVDDGQIIKFAYSNGMEEEKIKKLKKILWDNRCRGEREKCPHGKKKLRFEDMMKVCSGKVEGWNKIDSPFLQFLDIWSENVEKMYGPFKDKIVNVQGKISSYKPVYRKGHEHLKILIYDTQVTLDGSEDKPIETRKFWIKITSKEFTDLLGEDQIHLDDIISITGKCTYDKYFYDYWVVDLTKLEPLEKGDGELISAPLP